MSETFDYHHFLHRPDDQAGEFLQWAEDIQASPGIPFGVPDIDAKVLPLRKGTQTILLGRPGMLKTSCLLALALAESRRIVQRGAWESECVVFASYEQSVEELSAMLQADIPLDALVRGTADLQQVRATAIKMIRRSLWFIGHGLTRVNRKAPRLTPEHLYNTVQVIQDEYHRKINLLCFDYLQLIPVENARDRVQQVTEVPIRIKELSMRIGCPVLLAAQARREVDTYKTPIPTLADCQYSSSIEQTADLILGLWRPFNTMGPNAEPISINNLLYPVTDKLLVMRMLKQRFAPGRYTWAVYFDPATLEMTTMLPPDVVPLGGL